MDGGADEKRMRLRYAGACRVCWVELPAKVEAIYERTTKTVRCGVGRIIPAASRAGATGRRTGAVEGFPDGLAWPASCPRARDAVGDGNWAG